jgi:multimeric flavodoxin WrbA
MAKKVVAIIGTYRKGGVIDSAVCEMLRGAQAAGAECKNYYLIDETIEFCSNCRGCMQDDSAIRSKCIIDDCLGAILDDIDEADSIILASPMNAGTVTAVTKRFMERLGVYVQWKWRTRGAPVLRRKSFDKKAVSLVSCAMPSWMATVAAWGMFGIMKRALKSMGAGRVNTIILGLVPSVPDAKPSKKQLERAYQAGQWLAA